MEIKNSVNLDVARRSTPFVIAAVQGETCVRMIEALLYSNGVAFPVDGYVASIAYKKPDGTSGWYDTMPDGTGAYDLKDNAVTIKLAPQMLTVPGNVEAVIRIDDETGKYRVKTFPFIISVTRDPAIDSSKSENYYKVQSWTDINLAFDDVVSFISNQNKTDDEKAQARANIGAADSEDVAEIGNVLSSIANTKNLFTGAELVEGKYYNPEVGGEAASTIYNYYKVQLSVGTYTITPAARFIYNATTEELISKDGAHTPKTFTLDIDSLCYITIYPQYDNKLFLDEYTEDEVESIGEYTLNEDRLPAIAEIKQDVTDNKKRVSSLLNLITTKNLLGGAELVEGAYNNSGIEVQSATYNCYRNVFLPAGTYVASAGINSVRFIYNMTANELLVNNQTAATEISFKLAEDSFCDITFYTYSIDPKVFSSKYTSDEVESIGKYTLSPNINVPNAGAYDYNNMLTGKKWVACGDSFTQGVASEGTLTEGLYAGKNKAYPYYIGNRCGMIVVNEAIGGSTMTYLEGIESNAFSLSRYQQIPADADYITLKFGINDDPGHKNAPIGTIDDADNTTFYGAWNVVMEHLITNHPTAHIGIIVTNGSVGGYADATIAIAKKWGVPYLNMATGEQVPLPIRSNRTDVCQAAVTARLNTFRVSETDLHPNAIAHEYESRYIEAWLMTI